MKNINETDTAMPSSAEDRCKKACGVFNYAAEMSKAIAEYKYILAISRVEHADSFFRLL